MTIDPVLLAIIAGCALVQSLFGTGLLLFGTPLLLLAGYSFPLILKILLPCSILVNVMQVAGKYKKLEKFGIDILIYTVPGILIGLLWVLLYASDISLQYWVAAALLLTAALRLDVKNLDRLKQTLLQYRHIYLFSMGLVHGLSNQGGGLLMVFTSSVFDEKKHMQVHTAWAYLLMAISQLILLETLNDSVRPESYFVYPVIVVVIYQLLGRRAFKAIDTKFFYNLTTALVLIFAVLMLVA